MFDIEIEEQEYYWNLWREERKIEKDIIDYKLDLLVEVIRDGLEEQRLSGFSNREIRKAMREEIREKRKIRNK